MPGRNMLGPMSHECPFGRECTCNAAAGKDRRRRRRQVKKKDRRMWKRQLLVGEFD